ncbi:MAG: AbrB/MazE/SpoVT family DNA-binding domain-containing protein [Verrucomicrobiota bacterium]
MATATITSKHQITIPKQIRTQLNLHKGDQVKFESNQAGKIVLQKQSTPMVSDGAAAKFMKRKKRLSIEEMKAAAKAGAVKSFKNS